MNDEFGGLDEFLEALAVATELVRAKKLRRKAVLAAMRPAPPIRRPFFEESDSISPEIDKP